MSECIRWTGAHTDDGYGYLYLHGTTYLAHRIVWMQDNGHTDLDILHSCDVRDCINIEHMRTGTNQDNVADRVARGRSRGLSTTHCPKGHEYTQENTIIHTKGTRSCRECHRKVALAYYHRTKERRAS